jgi:hypothetical protein
MREVQRHGGPEVSTFFEKTLVSRVNRRMLIRMVRFYR